MRSTRAPLVGGLALLTALAAGCGAASAHHASAAAHKPASAAPVATRTATPVQAPVAGKHAARGDHRRHYHRAMVMAPPAPAPVMNPAPPMSPAPAMNPAPPMNPAPAMSPAMTMNSMPGQ